MNPIKIHIVEDNPDYMDVLVTSLNEEEDFKIVSQHTTAYSSLAELSEGNMPDVILLDLNLPGLSGLDAIAEFGRLAPDTKILVITCSNQESDITKAIDQGASGYLLKDSSLEEITSGIRAISKGGMPIDPKMANYLLKRHNEAPSEVPDKALSSRELQILENIAKGFSQKEIGQQLNISPKTVDFHARRIYKKLDVSNAPAAVAKAYEAGDLPLNR